MTSGELNRQRRLMKPKSLLIPYFKENRYKIALGLISLIIVDLLQLIIPRIVKRAVDDLTTMQTSVSQMIGYASMVVAIAVLIGGFRYVWRRCLLGTSRRVEEGLRNRLFNHLQHLSPAYFDRTKTGDLMAHATNDIQQIRMAAGMGLVALNDAVILGAAAIAFMAYINITLTVLVLIPMPLIAFGTRFFSKRMHSRYQAVQSAFSDLTEVVRERFAGIRIIKAHARESMETRQVRGISEAYINQNIKLAKTVGVFFPLMLLLANLSMAIVLYFGGRLAIDFTISAGDLVAFISYLGLLTWPMMALGWVTNLIQRGRASLDRIGKIFNTPAEITDPQNTEPLESVQGRISFEEVVFSYPQNGSEPSAYALQNINLTLPAGQILGIVGPPGSGKTTLISLIARLYDPTAGRVLLDGVDIRNIRLTDLRDQIAFMPQEPFMFAGTVRDNIGFGDPSFTQPQIEETARSASLLATVEDFSDGFDTVVGEKGVILSGGQKQRIALARCLLKQHSVLILDDPISQVDFETGADIIATLRSLAAGRTIIIVSHRMSAVRFADRIISLDNGRIVESGTHKELVQSDHYYGRTFRLQELEEDFYAS